LCVVKRSVPAPGYTVWTIQ
jgi:hypothetical protein